MFWIDLIIGLGLTALMIFVSIWGVNYENKSADEIEK